MSTTSDDAIVNGSVKRADRVLHLLEILGSGGTELSAPQLAELTGIPRSSLHGLLRTLLNRAWIQESPAGLYALAPTALTVGVSYLDHDAAVTHATLGLERARERLGCTVNLARLIGDEIVYLAIREGADRRNLPSRLGRRLPAFATALGRVLLAELSVDEGRAILEKAPRESLTPHTTTDVDELMQDIDFARSNGYLVERAQTLDDVACIAVPLPYRLPATDAISCSMPLSDATDERVIEAARILQEEAAEVARTLRQLGVR